MHRRCSGGNFEEEQVNSIDDCAQKCLSQKRCIGFVFRISDEDENCLLKATCDNFDQDNNHISYLRHAFPGLLCYREKCDGEIVSESALDDLETCMSNMQSNGYLVINQQQCKTYLVCKVDSKSSHLDFATCNPGFLHEYMIDDFALQPQKILSDSKLHTCMKLNRRGFYSRYPWPSVNNNNKLVMVHIFGEKLFCSETSNPDGKVYVTFPIEADIEPSISGSVMKSCKLKTKSSSVCQYECNCDGKHCPAIQVSVKDFEQELEMCEIRLIVNPGSF